MVAFTAARVASKAGTASVARQSNSSTRVMAFAAPSSRMTPAGQSLSKSVAARVSSVKRTSGASRVVSTMAKKSVGDLSKADLEGKVRFYSRWMELTG